MAKFLCLVVLSLVAISLTTGAESDDRNEVFKTEAEYNPVKREARIQRNEARKISSQKKKANANNIAGQSSRTAQKNKKIKKAQKNDSDGKSSRKVNQTLNQKKANKKRTVSKNKKIKKARKTNTGGKSSRKVNQAEGEVASRQNTDDDCVSLFKKYARTNEKKATAVVTQVNRIRSFSDIQRKKKAKKGNFEGTLNTLLGALGGDVNNPTCDGVPIASTNNTAYQTDLVTLSTCDANIDSVCGDLANGNETENATLTTCLDAAVQFKTEFALCTDNRVTDTCNCIDVIDKDNFNVLSGCNTAAKNVEATKKKKACLETFQECKTAQDDSASGVDLCKERNKCAGAKSKEEAEQQLQVLNPLKEALRKSAVVNDALTSLGLADGAGSDGQWPASGGASVTGTDGEGCKELDAEWTSFNETADNAASSANSDLDDTNAEATTATLNRINSRPNLTADLASCAPESSGRLSLPQITVTVTIVRIRIYLFWCFWWRVTVIEIKIVILTVTYGIEPAPSSTIAPIPTTEATTARYTYTATATTEDTTAATTEITTETDFTTAATTPSVTTASPVQNKRFLRDILKRSIGNKK